MVALLGSLLLFAALGGSAEAQEKGRVIQIGTIPERMLFDMELMKVTAGWSDGYLAYRPNRADEHSEYRLQIGGKVHHVLPEGRGWATSTGRWHDERPGSLGIRPKEEARFEGRYRSGNRTLLNFKSKSGAPLKGEIYHTVHVVPDK